MPAGEVVGLSLTIALFAFLSGVLVAASRHHSGLRKARDRDAWRAVLSRFLSARRVVTRASLALVASLRALNDTRENSPHMRWRTRATRAARRRLHHALDNLDRAEADWIVWFPEMEGVGDHRDRVNVATMRAAIDGSTSDVEALAGRLHRMDRLAGDRVRSCARTLGCAPRGRIVSELFAAVKSIRDGFRRR